MKKMIWIIDHYSSEPKYGGISRQYDFAKELSQRGHKVVIFSSSYSHFTHSYFSEKKVFCSGDGEGIHYIYLKTSSYVSNSGVKRLINMLTFAIGVLLNYKKVSKKYGKPDVVTGCSVHPFAWCVAHHIAKVYGCRFCVEVRDFWPGIWIWSGEKSKYHPMVMFFNVLEKWAYKKADKIIYSMRYGKNYICDELGIVESKAILIGQPIDCERYDKYALSKKELIPKDVREFMKEGFICVFTGYYMSYEGVFTMLEAAEILEKKKIPIKMVFAGSGQEENAMRAFAVEHNLKNVCISGRISKEAIPALLRMSDVCMAHLHIEGQERVYKYGVSKNKVIEYLYSGGCTLYGFSDKKDWVEESGAGYVYTPFCSDELAGLIEKVYNMPLSQRKKFGECGKNFIQKNHKVQVLTDKLEEVLLGK